MYKQYFHLPFSFMSLCSGVVAILMISYIGLIAVIMSYATLTVEFSQSVRNSISDVAKLESKYLATVTRITNVDYANEGYAKPISEVFVSVNSATALR